MKKIKFECECDQIFVFIIIIMYNSNFYPKNESKTEAARLSDLML